MRVNRLIAVILLALIPMSVLAGITGKVRGRITDKQTGEPLVGASVVIKGTTLGASANVEAEYIILNVPAGTYTIEGKYLGYQPLVVQNVQVSADLTTEVNFPLQALSEGLQLTEVVVQRERELVNKNATNAVRIATGDEVRNLPVRGVVSAIVLSPGVVQQQGNLYIRGGRFDEVGYYFEGANARNVLTGAVMTTAIPEALEEYQVQAGGYTAQYGGANAGIVKQSLRSGTSELKFSLQAESDNFAKEGKQFLGTYSYGYSNYVATISGPIFTDRVKFFIAGENQFARDLGARFWKGFRFENLPDQDTPGDTVRLLEIPDGRMPGQTTNRYTTNGTLTLDFNPFVVRLAGAYTYQKDQGAQSVFNILDLSRLGITESGNLLLNGKFTHLVSPKVFYEVNLSYGDNRNKNYDPLFEDDFLLYSDSLAHAQKGVVNAFTSYALTKIDHNLYGFYFNRPGVFLQGYGKNMQTRLGVSVDATAQLEQHELRFGGSFERYEWRTFTSGSQGLLSYYRLNPDLTRTPGAERDYNVLRNGGVQNIGYDAYGNQIETDDIVNGARHPVYWAAYVQDKIEFSDLVVNAGLRYDYFDNDDRVFIDDPTTPDIVESRTNPSVDANTFLYRPTGIKRKDPVSIVSPRLGFSFPVTDRTVFHLQWGKFVQAPKLDDIYISQNFWRTVFTGGNAILNPRGTNIDPQRTTQYEVGFTQQLTDHAAFDITAYYKDIRGQLQVQRIATEPTSVAAGYNMLVNGDFATTKGVELSFRLRRVERMSGVVNYTFADAKGTGSSTRAGGNAVSALENGTNYPTVISPLDFSQAHRGSVMLDYRFDKGDGGPILQRLGLNMLFTFNSGRPFTFSTGSAGQQGPGTGALIENDVRNGVPLEPVNASTTPWVFLLDMRLDKTVDIGPLATTFYVYVQNLLDTRNTTLVYRRSGSADDDGYLTNPDLSGKVIESFGDGAPTYVAMYKAINLELGQLLGNMWTPPRQIRFGIRLEY